MNARRDVTDYLRDIVNAMERVHEFISGMDLEAFSRDVRTHFAVLHALEIVGEATKHVPPAVRRRYPAIPWRRMAGMRDRLIHGYFGVDIDIVWETATRLVPELKPQIIAALEAGQRRKG
jgi:uncharacterized protein with HEPN domain